MTNESIPLISHNALVLIGDGQKALFLRNKGTAHQVRLEVEQVLESRTIRQRASRAPTVRAVPFQPSVRREAR